MKMAGLNTKFCKMWSNLFCATGYIDPHLKFTEFPVRLGLDLSEQINYVVTPRVARNCLWLFLFCFGFGLFN